MFIWICVQIFFLINRKVTILNFNSWFFCVSANKTCGIFVITESFLRYNSLNKSQIPSTTLCKSPCMWTVINMRSDTFFYWKCGLCDFRDVREGFYQNVLIRLMTSSWPTVTSLIEKQRLETSSVSMIGCYIWNNYCGVIAGETSSVLSNPSLMLCIYIPWVSSG